MKVSAVLVGVNVAATLSVAAQHPALAQDQNPLALGTSGSTAAFLKSSLADAAAPVPAPVQLSAVPQKLGSSARAKSSISSPKSVATRKALSSQGVALRPFVANRKLPSKFELDKSLSMQTAVMDYSNQPTMLDGGVSEYANYYASSENQDVQLTPRAKYAVKQQQRRAESNRLRHAAKVASGFIPPAAPRAVPGAMPAVPGQVGFPCAEQNYAGLCAPQAPVQTMQAPVARRPMPLPEAPLKQPHLSPQEQLEMNRLVETACIQNGVDPHAVAAGAQPPQQDLYARVGPPPFPLSLIPEDAMKDFLKGARSRKSAIAGSSLAMNSGGGVGMGGSGHLPAGGFRSYMQAGAGASTTTTSQGFGNFSRLSTAVPIAKHQIQPHASSKAHHPKKVASPQHEASKIPQNQVLVYPPYKSQVNFGS